jgi:group I intron endonuclease
MKGVIYCYHCIPTGKKYIGQTLYEARRKALHLYQAKNDDTKFYRAVRKYGWENFIYGIVDKFDAVLLNEKEVYYIDYYGTFKNGYNSTLGGHGAQGRVISEEEKEKSKNRMIANNPMKNNETRNKVSKSLIGKKIPKEVIDKIINTRRTNPNGWNSKERNKKCSITMKTKISMGYKNPRLGTKHTEETKKLMSEKKIGNTNVRGKKWWNDGQTNKMSVECPGIEWVSGRCPKKQ